MFNCILIPNTKYALLIIEYKHGITEFNIPGNNLTINNYEKNKFSGPAIKFLKDKGITHNDSVGNLFYYMDGNDKIFYWIDFEASTFSQNAMNKIKNNNLIKPPPKKIARGSNMFNNV